jgi:site-specific DNA-methyltransferase (adenine-specific)
METLYLSDNGRFVHGDNLEALKKFKPNCVDSCISDFPYDLSFMGKKWDTTGDFYKWCSERAIALLRVIKPGGYVCIFGHPKTNHRMKCAFEDAGFNIVEEIEWIYGTGFPKNQDIGKLFDKKAGAEREIVGSKTNMRDIRRNVTKDKEQGWNNGQPKYVGSPNVRLDIPITAPNTEQAKKWNGWKTTGLKPAHEPITIFQKPLEGTYIQNIEKWDCGAFNIDACRIPTSQADKDVINAKSSKNPTSNYSEKDEHIYGNYAKDIAMPANELGRFPANVVLEETIVHIMDEQSGVSKSSDAIRHNDDAKYAEQDYRKYGKYTYHDSGGFTDSGGASRFFLNISVEPDPMFYYCAKPTKKEKGEGNTHVTVKPKELIKWVIKLVTPKGGKTIDITAGSGTHALACEELNKFDGYNLKWVDIELSNSEQEPYCNIAISRINNLIEQ